LAEQERSLSLVVRGRSMRVPSLTVHALRSVWE